MALALFVLADCATTKIYPARRVGRYSVDQAVIERGPPDKPAKLSNGSLVVDWLTRRSWSGRARRIISCAWTLPPPAS